MGAMAAYHEIDGIPDDRGSLPAQDSSARGVGLPGVCAFRPGRDPAPLYDASCRREPKDASCMAIRAGVDMQFYDFDHDRLSESADRLRAQRLAAQADLDRAVRSVLRVKFALGLFDHPFVDPALNPRVHRSPRIWPSRSNRRASR